jgi:hypothetical protein
LRWKGILGTAFEDLQEGLMSEGRARQQAGSGGRRSYADLLHYLLSSVPVWIRGTVLLTLIGILVAVAIVFSSAALSGVAIEFGPLKISEYQPPVVRNCQQVIALLPSVQQEAESKLQPLFKQLAVQIDAANAMRKTSIEYRGSLEPGRNYIGPVAEGHAKEMVQEAQETRQDILNAYNRLSDELKNIRSICLEGLKK